MRRLIFQEYVTLDGYAAGLDGGLEFFDAIGAHPDEDNLDLLDSVDTMLLGAETYRLFAGFWPTEAAAEEPIAAKLNALRLVVVSTTLASAPWGSYEPGLVVRDLDAVRALKAEQTGKDIILWGSITLFQSLLRAGLVDEVQLRICPVLLGAGKSAFPAGGSPVGLDLIEARPWGTGGVLVRYRPTS
ncbi:dihydrofolate reductase family protein [Kribbella shirazensis]|uniref:Dihydrofolate reductase n=1 Tax=Kribbella shirazensis TaxID=1105143 RepID=A0A7X5VB83_9ACTN|nr:dihydrofolate reductase family protein [Kribbella shirazensis]NIK58031.1 dihydrofolate reductase [Kribbella shirazensis]